MIASLGMYDRPEMGESNDRFWSLIATELKRSGIDAPDRLTYGNDAYWHAWTSADLVLSQTCGLPYRSRLHDKVTLIGTPCYGVAGCPEGHYNSVIVVRKADAALAMRDILERKVAFNDPLSQSGWAALQGLFQHHGAQPEQCLETGSHFNSALSVVSGAADYAAIDAVTWALLERSVGWTGDLAVVARTEPTPGLPLISAAGADQPTLFAAVATAIDNLSAGDRETLLIRKLVYIPARDYLRLPIPPAVLAGPADL